MSGDRRGQGPDSVSEDLKQEKPALALFGLGWLLLAVFLWLWALFAPSSALVDPQASLIISEFMASNNGTLADSDGDPSDWIEIHNRGTAEVNLGGWYLTDDDRDLTKWQFPPTPLAENSYLIVFASGKDLDTEGSELHANFGLESREDYLALVRPDGVTIASDYAPKYPPEFNGMPYPWVGALTRCRGIAPNFTPHFADISYGLDADLKERYFTVPTPGAVNGSAAADQGPFLSTVSHAPPLPISSEPITITAAVNESPVPIGEVMLHYRVMFKDAVALPMFDDGIHDDGDAGDGVYGATIPSEAHQPGEMVRYFVTATDQDGHSSRWPFFKDPINSPEYLGTMIADPNVGSSLPVLYWFIQDPQGAENMGTRASVFCDGTLYDNVLVRPRGGGEVGGTSYKSRAWPKKSFKFDFNQGYHFQFSADTAPVEEFNLNSTYSDKSYIRQLLAWETLHEAGVPSSISFPMRVQQNGAFHSVAIFVEQVDKRYLERQELNPEGALYKMLNPAISADVDVGKRTRLDEGHSDLQALLDGIQQVEPARTDHLFDHVDIPATIDYLAANTIIHNIDHVSMNYYLYRDTEETGEWMILPWDLDLTFGRNNVKGDQNTLNDVIWADDATNSHPLVGSSSYPKVGGAWNRIMNALYDTPAIQSMYLRRLRSLMDELLQSPDTPAEELIYEQRIDELVAEMQPDVALDAARWSIEWGSPQSFAEATDLLKTDYLAVRRVHLYETLGEDNGGIIPDRQPVGAALEFGTIESAPASGNRDEEYFCLVNANPYAVDISGWGVSGDIEYTFRPGVVVPAGGSLHVSPDVSAFRQRSTSPTGGEGHFVQGDYSGRLSDVWGTLHLSNADGVLAASASFFGPGSLAQPVTITLR